MMKRTIALIIAMVMILGSVSVFAAGEPADGSIVRVKASTGYTAPQFKGDPVGKVYSGPVYSVITALRVEVTLAPQNFNYVHGGKQYSLKEIADTRKANPALSLDEVIAKLDPVTETPEEELKVIDISVINDTTLAVGKTITIAPVALDAEGNEVEGVKYSFLSSDEAVVTVDEDGLVTAKAVGQAEVTVATTNAVEDVKKTIAVTVVEAANVEDIEMKITPDALVADGKTVMNVEVTVNLPDPETAKEMGAMLEINSKLGLKASKAEEALNNGKATFKIQLPSSIKRLEDTITVTIKSHDTIEGKVSENQFVGKTIVKDVIYTPRPIDGEDGEEITLKSYEVADVRSMDMADRVAIYVNMPNLVHEEEVKEAIKEQVRLYNTKGNKNNPLSIIKVEDAIELETGGYVFVSLISLGTGTKENVLHDNQYNYYEVLESDARVSLKKAVLILAEEGANYDDQRFMLVDGDRPEVRTVKSTLNDRKYLPNDSILVEYNEPVNKETATDPTNYTINGRTLTAKDIRKITLIDVDEAYAKKDIPKWTAINKAEGKERNSVIIELSPSFARTHIRNGQKNVLQVKSVADWAGLTDLGANNKISTQDFDFNYNVPETKLNLSIESQSPEQFVIKLNDDLYKDKNTSNKFDFASDAIKVALEGLNKNGEEFEKLLAKTTDYQIRRVEEDGVYILELTQDWTRILENSDINAYHGKTLKLSIIGETFNVYGEEVTGHKIGVDGEDADVKATLDAVVVINEDNVSPFIDDYEIVDKATGSIKLTMSKPVQLPKSDLINAHTQPKLTPTLGYKKVSEAEFEYVQIKDAEGNDLTSKGIRMAGQIVENSVNEYDTEFVVEPKEALAAGDWKLVVRAISDDVGNTMATDEEIAFTIDGEAPIITDMKVDPYLVWGYAIDDVKTDLDNDYVVLLFSREMDTDIFKSSTFNINGKALDQDTKINAELIPVYKNINVTSQTELHGKGNDKDKTNVEQWMAQLVMIELPSEFIVSEKDTNSLTLPNGLKAVDDNVLGTKDVLLGTNQYELDFENYDTLTKVVNGKSLLPGFENNTIKTKAAEHKTEFITELKGAANLRKAQAAVESINLAYNGKDDKVTLPDKSNGEAVTWTSGNTAVIKDNGDVTRPNYSDGTPVEVVMTASVTVGDKKAEAEHTVLVYQKDFSVEVSGADNTFTIKVDGYALTDFSAGAESIAFSNNAATIEINGITYTITYDEGGGIVKVAATSGKATGDEEAQDIKISIKEDGKNITVLLRIPAVSTGNGFGDIQLIVKEN